MKRSDSIAAIASALSKAQGSMKPALKDAHNPFFKSSYSDLASIINAIREPFAKNELAYSQFLRSTENGVEVETILMHSSGEWMSETLEVPVSKDDAQGLGSASSYGKRYGLQAISGVPSDDDDGNAATKARPARVAAPTMSPAMKAWLDKLGTNPPIEQLNLWIAEVGDLSADDKKQVWNLILGYADRHGWEFSKTAKTFAAKQGAHA